MGRVGYWDELTVGRIDCKSFKRVQCWCIVTSSSDICAKFNLTFLLNMCTKVLISASVMSQIVTWNEQLACEGQFTMTCCRHDSFYSQLSERYHCVGAKQSERS